MAPADVADVQCQLKIAELRYNMNKHLLSSKGDDNGKAPDRNKQRKAMVVKLIPSEREKYSSKAVVTCQLETSNIRDFEFLQDTW